MRFPSAGERRSSPRLRLPMMYTLLRAGPVSSNGFCWTGRAYDISASGMRFEVDGELRPGDVLNLRVLLPGRKRQLRLRVQGEVIRIHHPQLANGRACLAINFDRFLQPQKQDRLRRYVDRALARTRLLAA